MASKVNVKFVGILGGVLAVMVGVVGVMVYNSLRSSPAEHAAAGDKAAAAGDWEKAVRSYGNAVNKEQTNTEYLKKWADAISKTQPTSPDLYRERYALYLSAMRKIGESSRNNPDAHRMLLDQQLRDLRIGPSVPAVQAYLRDVDRILAYFPEGDPNRGFARRYRGAGNLLLLGQASLPPEVKPEDIRDDLDAALKFNPKDDFASALIGDWYYSRIDAARRDNDPAKAEGLLKEAEQRIAAFIAQNPPAPASHLALARIQIADAYHKDAGKTPTATIAASQQPIARKVMDAFRAADPMTLDETLVPAAIALSVMSGAEEAKAFGDEIFDKMIAVRPNDPVLLMVYGEMARMSNRHRETFDRFQRVVDMKDMPVSTAGMTLVNGRDMAYERQFEAVLGLWEQAKDEAEKKKHLDTARSLRDTLRQRLGDANPRVGLADAKLAFAAGDLVTARQGLHKYLVAQPNDPHAILVLANVLIKQDLLGAARTELMKLVNLRTTIPGVYATLAEIEGRMREYEASANHMEMALRLDPTNPVLRDRWITAKNLAAAEQAANPVIRALSKAQRMMNQAQPDFEGALKELDTVLEKEKFERSQDAVILAQGFVQMGERTKALAALDKGIAQFPDDASLPKLRESLVTAPTGPPSEEAVLKSIDESGRDDFTKAIQKASYFRRLNKPEQMNAELAKARALKPDDAGLIGFEFDIATQRKDFDTARKLADRAAATNADKVGGALFRAQLEAAQGRFADAAAFAQQSTDRDPLNAIAWRMLGEIRIQMRLYPEAIEALERARQIKPDDLQTLTTLVKLKMSTGRTAEALALAREGIQFSANDSEFFNLWCAIEFEYGDQAKALERRARLFQNNPNDRTNAIELARMHLRRRNYRESAEVIVQLEKAPAVEGSALAIKAVLIAATGDADGAVKVFDEAVAAIPEAQRKGGEHIYFARALAENGFVDVATRVLESGRKYQDTATLPVDGEIADTYFNSRQYEKAVTAYQRMRDGLTPEAGIPALKRQIEALGLLGKNDEATALLDSVKDKEGSDKQLLILRAQIAVNRRDLPAARAALDRALSLDPSMAPAYMLRGTINLDDPAYEKDARADLEQALKLDPNNIGARRVLFRYHFRAGERDRAFAVMRDGVNLNPDNAQLRLELGQLMVLNGMSEEALALFAEGIRRQPRDQMWYAISGEVYAQRRDWGRAIERFKAAWEREKTAPLAIAYCDALLSSVPPDAERAVVILAEPSIKTEESWALLCVRARAAMLQGRTADGEADIIKAAGLIEKADLATAASFMRGVLIAHTNPRLSPAERPADALAVLRRAAPAAGHGDAMRLTIARVQVGIPQQREAGMAELQAMSASADKVVAMESYKTLGSLLYADNKFAEAVEAYQKALAINDRDPEVLNNLAYTLSSKLARHSDALPMALKAVEVVPNNASIIDTLGSVYLALKEYDKAEEALNRAIAAASSPMERTMPLVHLTIVRLEKNDRAGADQVKQKLDRTLEQDPQISERYRTDLENLRKRLEARN